MSFVTASLSLLALAAPLLHAAAPPHHESRSANIPYGVSANSIDLEFYGGEGNLGVAQSSGQLDSRTVLDSNVPRSSIPLLPLAQAYVIPTKIGSQNFFLLVDTGSADTWVADSYFRCGSSYQSSCELGPTFELKSCDASAKTVFDGHFSLSYADGTHVSGPMMSTDLSLAPNLKFTQEIGLAQYLSWIGGYNVTSGVLGLAHSAITTKFPGTDISGYDDIRCPPNGSTIVYDPYGRTHTCNQVPSTGVGDNLNSSFTLALARASKDDRYGGSITFGGVPKSTDPTVNVTGQYVTVPMEALDLYASDTLTYHVISVDGIQIPLTYNATAALPTTTSSYPWSTEAKGKRDVLRRSNSRLHYIPKRSSNTQFHAMSNGTGGKAQFVVDSGTAVNFFPLPIAKAINQLFQPPAYTKYGITYVNCTALQYPPSIAIKIGGVDFLINPEDMVVREQVLQYNFDTGHYGKTEVCFSAVQETNVVDESSGAVLNILGQSFLKNVMMTFDIPNEQIGLISRPYYASSRT